MSARRFKRRHYARFYTIYIGDGSDPLPCEVKRYDWRHLGYDYFGPFV